jgi:hypothetical protein
LLDEAEKRYNKTTTKQGIKDPPIKRKRRRETPPEQLTISDEEKFAGEERRLRKKLKKLDRPYHEDGVPAETDSGSQDSI